MGGEASDFGFGILLWASESASTHKTELKDCMLTGSGVSSPPAGKSKLKFRFACKFCILRLLCRLDFSTAVAFNSLA